MPKKAYRVAWIGPESTAIQYFLDRFKTSCTRLGYEPRIMRTTLADADIGDQDRILLSSLNRADFPFETSAALEVSGTIVPWGVVTDSWHFGSRRSGPAAITHWQQPWFRWWDSWFGWFFPEAARPGSLTASAFSPIVTPLDYALPCGAAAIATHHDSHLAILSACRNTAHMLGQQATQACWTSSVCQTLAELAVLDSSPDRVVWDDTLLPCLPGESLDQPVHELFGQLEQLVPIDKLITSIGAENLHLWSALQERGCVDLIVKPGHALALSNLLYHHDASQRQLA